MQSRDNDGMSGQSIHPNKSSWMTHWSQTSYKSSPQSGDHLSLRYKSKGDNHGSTRCSLPDEREISSDFSKSGKRFREVVEASQLKFFKKGVDSCSFPGFDLCQNRESDLGSKNKQLPISSKEVLKSPVDRISGYDTLALGSNESSLRRNHFHHEGNLDASSSFQGDFMGSATNVMHGFNTEIPENNNQLDFGSPLKEHFRSTVTRVEHERQNYYNFPSLLMRGEKMNQHLSSIPFANSLLKESYQNFQKKSENMNHGCNSQQKMPHCAPDVETMKVYSQTTHRMFITTKPGVNLNEEEVRGNNFNEVLNLFPDLGSHEQTGLKLQPLESSLDCERTENIAEVKTCVVDSDNESAETDIMDMDAAFKENYQRTDLALSLSTKAGENVSSSQLIKPSSNNEQVRGKSLNAELPDINEVPPSASKAQGLDVDHILSITGNFKSVIYPDILGPELNSRCIKRLKMSTTDCFAYGTKIGESPQPHEKVEQPVIYLEGNVGSSEPRSDAHQIALLLKNCESPSAEEPVKRGKEDITISHPWIRRWCRNSQVPSPKKIRETVVVCEPESSKAALEKYQKKQFPSIAAMALVGKAMNGFQPCELKKRGSFVVWNTKEL